MNSVPKIELKYDEDQWSPLNPTGKKEYDREFLLSLQQNTYSLAKPENLPDLPDVILENSRFNEQHTRPLPNKSYNNSDFFTPGYVKSMVGSSSVGRDLHKAESSWIKSMQEKKMEVCTDADKDKSTENNWVPMRVTINPKTIDQIRKEAAAEKEREAMKAAQDSHIMRPNMPKDQWSPLNPAGKKEYDREFLLSLKQNTYSLAKPENLPDLPDVTLENRRFNEQYTRPLPNKSYTNPDFFTPGYVKPMVGTGSGSRQGPGSIGRRGSQPSGGSRDLHKAESSWIKSMQVKKMEVCTDADEEKSTEMRSSNHLPILMTFHQDVHGVLRINGIA